MKEDDRAKRAKAITRVFWLGSEEEAQWDAEWWATIPAEERIPFAWRLSVEQADEPLHQDFVDLLRAFAAADVRFLVVGAYALAVHGVPRATGDLDVWIDPTPANARRAYGALRDFGAPLANLLEKDLTDRDLVFQMGVAPVRIDVLMGVSGVEFPEAWERRTEGVFEDVRFPVIGFDDLVRNKRATARPKDLVDLEILERQRRR